MNAVFGEFYKIDHVCDVFFFIGNQSGLKSGRYSMLGVFFYIAFFI